MNGLCNFSVKINQDCAAFSGFAPTSCLGIQCSSVVECWPTKLSGCGLKSHPRQLQWFFFLKHCLFWIELLPCLTFLFHVIIIHIIYIIHICIIIIDVHVQCTYFFAVYSPCIGRVQCHHLGLRLLVISMTCSTNF